MPEISSRELIFPDFSIDNFIPLPLLSITNDPKSGKMFLDPQILKNPIKVNYNKKVRKILHSNKKKFDKITESEKEKRQIVVEKEREIVKNISCRV